MQLEQQGTTIHYIAGGHTAASTEVGRKTRDSRSAKRLGDTLNTGGTNVPLVTGASVTQPDRCQGLLGFRPAEVDEQAHQHLDLGMRGRAGWGLNCL